MRIPGACNLVLSPTDQEIRDDSAFSLAVARGFGAFGVVVLADTGRLLAILI